MRNQIGLFTFNRRRITMRLPSISAVVLGTAVGLSATIFLHCPVWAQGVPPATQGIKPAPQGAAPAATQSIQGATGQLKTDTSNTKDDVKAMDVNKAQQDAGQVKKDVQGLEDATKGGMTNPFGK
jgi:hypothetical protein